MEAWRGHSSLCPFKRGATRAEWPFHHRFRSRKIFGAAKDFCPIFSKLRRKVFCATFVHKFSPTKIIKTFFGVTSEKVFMCFSANLGRHFLKSSNVGSHFYAYFQGCCPDFQQITTFGGALAPSSPPPPTPLL